VRRAFLAALCASLAVAIVLPSTSSAGSTIRFFHTLDNNIGCGIIKGAKKRRKHGRKIPKIPGEARCDVRTHTWVAPPKPASCPLDWGNGVSVGDRGPAGYVCAGDSVADASSPAVGPGTVITLGRYTCSVLAASVRCTNNLTGSGFEVSAATVQLF
jgi:Family of unknown function (DUF6636)